MPTFVALNMKRSGIRILSMLLGIIIALSIVFSQFLHVIKHQNFTSEIKKEHQDDTKKNQKEHNFNFVLSSSTLTSSSLLELNQEACFLFEISFEDDKPEDFCNVPPLSLNQFFRVLLRIFVAPNAP